MIRALAMLVLLAAAAAGQPRPGGSAACPATFEDVAEDALTCVCDAEATAGSRPVWGTSIYTSDSAICRAALHAGAAPVSGGRVRLQAEAGRQTYAGSMNNGVRSESYGPWARSFRFLDADLATGDSCPNDLTIVPDSRIVCSCTPEAIAASSPVWGTDLYSNDSAVCAAAVHAGVIGPEGGMVAVVPAPGQPAYRGSTRHGVTTSNWEAWPNSFTVEPPK